ncbi:MAG: hypothetical protein QOG01_704 [Pseudonocardiales bacterium]|jgi:hypothetical protein|nr:hypothetical protein [Pseudonocardiales bacterium]
MTAPPARLRVAQAWHALTALVALVSVTIELVLVADGHNPLLSTDAPPVATRVIRFFSYFTIESNLLVMITAAMLAVRADRDGRLWRVLRLDALFGITVTLVTYAVLLAPQHDPHGVTAWTNAGLHYMAPIMTIVGWVMFGPRPRIGEDTILLALIWPALYIAYTLAHGAASDWYPYPFIDVAHLGYATALRNGVGLIVLMAGVATLYRAGDTRLPRT